MGPMNSLHTDDQDVRDFLRGATDAAAPTLHAPASDEVVALGTRRIRQRRLAAAGSGLVAAAVIIVGATALGGGFHRADLRPGQTSSSTTADPMRPGTVKIAVPRNAGADTTYSVSIFPAPNGGGQVRVSSGSWGGGGAFAPGLPIDGATPDVRLVIVPSDAVSATLLPTAPTGGTISSGPTRIPGTAWSVAAFRYDVTPATPPTKAMWFRADGTPVTTLGAGSVVAFGEVRVWLNSDADQAGLSFNGSSASFTMAGQGPMNGFQMSQSADADTWLVGGYIADTATDVRVVSAGNTVRGAVQTKPIPGTTWTAFLVRVTSVGHGPAATVTWTGSDGQTHSGPA
jgi:hypothetical protein